MRFSGAQRYNYISETSEKRIEHNTRKGDV